VKQVIVVRMDLQMGKGKLAAQVAHAAYMWVVPWFLSDNEEKPHTDWIIDQSEKMEAWLRNGMTKVTVRATDQAHLHEIYEKAKAAGLEAFIVTDEGRTEFHGVPTETCLGIGPDEDDRVDSVTGGLKLL
jgi:peptidyl-tRNA hydrolase, PTH2 family